MHLKRGLVFLVFLLVLPIANSDLDFQCEDGTFFGSCSDKGEICAGSENLIVDNKINLDAGKEYLFFGRIEGGCYLDLYDLYIGNKKLPLTVTKSSNEKRVVSEFLVYDYINPLSGDLDVKCRASGLGGSVNLTKKYLGKVSDEADLFGDCSFCGKCDSRDIRTNLNEGEIITQTDFQLRVDTDQKSECTYKLFRELDVKSVSGTKLDSSDGLTHYSTLKGFYDGDYILEVQCKNDKNEIREADVSFNVQLDRINAEISIATTKGYYYSGDKIELTDPPGLSEPPGKITGNVIKETPDYVSDNKAADDNGNAEPNGYIIEFEDDPILVRKANLEKQAKEDEEYVDTHAAYHPNVLAKRFFGVFPDEVDDELDGYAENLDRKNFAVRSRILTELNKRDYVTRITGYAVGDDSLSGDELGVFHEYKNVFNGIALDISKEEAEKIKSVLGVKKIHPNYPIKADLQQSVGLINADDVWSLRGDNGEFLTGKGVDIAVIDTGVNYGHPDLGSCSRDQFLNGDCGKVVGGYDFYDDDNDPMDCDGHGTHVASTAAGNGILKGVAPDARVYAYRVLDCHGSGNSADLIASIERVMDPNGDGDFSDHHDIISMSLGWPPFFMDDVDEVKAQTINNAVNAGVVAVISAGNRGIGYNGEGTIGSPGIARNAITVGAADKGLHIAEFSSRGPALDLDRVTRINKPDIVAPGVDICAAAHVGPNDCNSDDKHVSWDGTSMSQPHVAGAAALLIQKNPDWTPFEIKEALKSTAVDLGEDINTQGAGFLDILRAVSLEKPPAIMLIDSINKDRENITIIGTITHADFGKYEIYIKKKGEGEFNKIHERFEEVRNEVIFTFSHASLEVGNYELELRVYDIEGSLIGNKIISFVIPNVELLDVANDYGVDEDEDGEYDALVVELDAYARSDGSGTIEADLRFEREEEFNPFVPLSDDEKIAYHYSVIKGDNVIKLEFEGSNIRRGLVNRLGIDPGDKMKFKLKALSSEDDRERVFDLVNEYGIDDFDKIVEFEALDIISYVEGKIFLGSENELLAEIKNNGNAQLIGKASVYEVISKGDNENKPELDLVYFSQIFEERFYDRYRFEFDYIPDGEGLHKLRLIIEAEEDINLENNVKDVEIFVYPKKPDILAGFNRYIEDDNVLIYNEPNEIRAVVANRGKANAKDVNVSLFFINPENAKEKIFIESNSVDVRANDFNEINFEWTPQIKGEIILRLEVDAEEDIDLDNNYDERNYVVVANAPDINVAFISVERRLPVDEKVRIDVILENIGIKDAENVNVTVLGENDGESFEINSSYVEEISSGRVYVSSVEWIPKKTGTYKIIALAEAEGDENPENSRKEIYLDVLPKAPDVVGHYEWGLDRLVVNQPYNLSFKVENQGFESAERINVSLFKRGREDELIGSEIIDSLSPSDKKEIVFGWTPEIFGQNNLKLVVEAENDANIDNNIYDFSLKVLSDKPDVRIHFAEVENKIVVNKENPVKFYLSNEGAAESSEVFVLFYHVDEISGEETLIENRNVGILKGGDSIFSEFNYMPEEVGVKNFRLKAAVENDYELGNNEENFLMIIAPQSRLINLGSNVLEGYLLLEFQELDTRNWKWGTYAVLIDDQKNGNLRRLEKGEVLALDRIYNELEVSEIIHTGRFRIYAAFLDENRNIIEGTRLLEASHEFGRP